jgi:predicted DsbA family dithiol-disulfide isomerase
MLRRMRLEVVSDTVCPWCLIGKRRLEKALARRQDLDLEVVWRPFELNPDTPALGFPREAYLEAKFGGSARAEQIYAAIRAAGESEEIAFDFERISHVPNTVDSHRLIDWAGAEGKQDAVVERLFSAYFIEGRDVGDHEVLAQAATAAGMDGARCAARLATDEDRERICAESAEARSLGVQGVPFFIFDRKYAISGAQTPDVFLRAFDTVEKESAEAAPTLT